jgi:hypothetical protein
MSLPVDVPIVGVPMKAEKRETDIVNIQQRTSRAFLIAFVGLGLVEYTPSRGPGITAVQWTKR